MKTLIIIVPEHKNKRVKLSVFKAEEGIVQDIKMALSKDNMEFALIYNENIEPMPFHLNAMVIIKDSEDDTVFFADSELMKDVEDMTVLTRQNAFVHKSDKSNEQDMYSMVGQAMKQSEKQKDVTEKFDGLLDGFSISLGKKLTREDIRKMDVEVLGEVLMDLEKAHEKKKQPVDEMLNELLELLSKSLPIILDEE